MVHLATLEALSGCYRCCCYWDQSPKHLSWHDSIGMTSAHCFQQVTTMEYWNNDYEFQSVESSIHLVLASWLAEEILWSWLLVEWKKKGGKEEMKYWIESRRRRFSSVVACACLTLWLIPICSGCLLLVACWVPIVDQDRYANPHCSLPAVLGVLSQWFYPTRDVTPHSWMKGNGIHHTRTSLVYRTIAVSNYYTSKSVSSESL